MRTVTIEILNYDELPTDKAKETARKWLGECLANDPDTSDFQAIVDKIQEMDPADLRSIAGKFAECPLTGFYADHDALEPVHKALQEDPETPAEDLRRVAIAAVWKACEDDRESKQEKDYLEEMIRANDYEFTADGKRTSL